MRLIPLLLILGSCRHESVVAPDPGGPAVASFRDWTLKRGSVVFRSFGGRWIGTDVDLDLHFLPDQKVKMVRYGYALETYWGTYRMDEDGELSASFERYGQPWPVLILERDSRSLLLRPKEAATGSSVGMRGFWPLRPPS